MNLFHKGFAKEADDPAIVAATMAKPGVVLQRPVGTYKRFREHADLPTDLPLAGGGHKVDRPRKKAKASTLKIDDETSRKASAAYALKERQRENEQRRVEAAEAKLRERRQGAVARAAAALKKAHQEHDAKADAIRKQRDALDQRAQAEEDRWEELRKRLEAGVRKAGG